MKQIRLILLLTLAAATLGAQSQPASAVSAENAESATTLVNPDAQSPSVRILTPSSGQILASTLVNLRFELAQPWLDGEPVFIVQLDAADPIRTSSTNHTFAGLQPGLHSVEVTLVDKNDSPVQGGSATVGFKVPSSAHTVGSREARQHTTIMIVGVPPGAPIPPELRKDGDINLPLAGSPLPLVSLIGFGLLIGGAAQSIRRR